MAWEVDPMYCTRELTATQLRHVLSIRGSWIEVVGAVAACNYSSTSILSPFVFDRQCIAPASREPSIHRSYLIFWLPWRVVSPCPSKGRDGATTPDGVDVIVPDAEI